MARSYPGADVLTQTSIDAMYRATTDDRGTVQALARELDDADMDGARILNSGDIPLPT